MTSANFLRYAGWAAMLSAMTSLLTVITGILMFTVSPFFGGFSDVFSVLTVGFMIPVAPALHFLLRSQAPVLSLAAAVIGILSMVLYGILLALLVARVLTYEQVSLTNIIASGGIGIWLLLANYAAVRGKVFPRGLAWTGLITGGGFLVLVLGFAIYPIWAVWLGRWLLAMPHREFQGGDLAREKSLDVLSR
jgi:hypothetical protein